MIKDILIGIDAGTSVIKAVAFSLAGEMLASAAITNHYQILEDGGAEQDMARTWSDVRHTLLELHDKVPDITRRTAAIAVTAQGDGTWLIDEAGEPVAPAWLWLDTRATEMTESVLASATYPHQYQTTGTALNACQQSAQLAWLKRERPDVLRRATTAFHCKDWLYFKMTGVRAVDPAESSFTFGNFRTRRYAMELLEPLGLAEQRRLLPPIVDGTRHAHRLSARAAVEIGWPEGTPIVLGYLDAVCVGLGAGVLTPGADRGCSILGSTGLHMRMAASAEAVVLNPGRSGYTIPFPGTPMIGQMQSNMASALNVDWLIDLARGILADAGLGRSREDILLGLEDSLLTAKPSGVIYHPYITEAGERGPFLDRHARAQFTGLSQQTSFADLLKALYEGLAMAARDCYVAMGGVPAEINLAGGVARSHAMRSILASILGVPVRTVTREEAGAAGVAMIAAVQLGLYADMQACSAAWVEPHLGELTQPDLQLRSRYNAQFNLYRSLRLAVQPSWPGLVDLKRGHWQ
jgi:erythritol kinase